MLALARLASLALFALSLFTLTHAASPAARRAATNAERLARGLAPARPRRLYNPSRANVARSAPSGLPGSTQTGKLGIYPAGTSPTLRKRDGSLGFMGAYGLVAPDSTLAWAYSFTEPTSSSTVLELNHAGTPYRLAGVAIRSGPQVTLGPGNSVYLELQNVRSHTDAGSATSVYVYDTYAIGYAQTTIFAIDQTTGKLSVHWVNPDGSIAPQYIILSGTNIYVTGDVSALQTQLGSSAQLNPIDIFFDVSDS
ncbi:hypothetical protein C8Q73DRAFT_44856 [Cubamyces lactineus]|nr:hypothetical protein C8Q73DRAFT_44856 [Cubamyces lactineus]